MNVLVSRRFVEFGPFTLAEFQALHSRGVIHDCDFIHAVGSNQGWYPTQEFLEKLSSISKKRKIPAPKKPKVRTPRTKP